MGIVLLLASWAHEYLDVFVNNDGHRIKLEVCDIDKT